MTTLLLAVFACAPPDGADSGREATGPADGDLERRASRTWTKLASIDFTAMADQDLTVDPTFDVWTAAHTTAASVFELQSGTGLVMFPDNGTNWTESAWWTAPYVSGRVADLIGRTPDGWIAIVAEGTMDSTALLPNNHSPSQGATVDMQLSYGPSHTGLQTYRAEQRTAILEDRYLVPVVRTYAGHQEALHHEATSFSSVIEIQLRGGEVRNFVGTALPTAEPEDGMRELSAVHEGRFGYLLDAPGPGVEYAYRAATDVISLSAYNWLGSGRTIIWKTVEIWEAR